MPAWDRVVVVSKARLPMGRFGGSLSNFTAQELGAMVISEVVKRAGLQNDQVDEVIFGHCRQAGTGANPARKAAILAGIAPKAPAVTINKACPSSLKATIMGAQSILAEENKVVITGGMESMSNIPHIVRGLRFKGTKFGDLAIEDEWTSLKGLVGMSPIEGAEYIAQKYGVTREEQDQFALESWQKTQEAWDKGHYADDVIPVQIPGKDGGFTLDKDETFRPTTLEALAKLPPAAKTVKSVTAGNSCGLGDGATALMLMDREHARQLGIKPLASLVSVASVGAPDTRDMFEGPALSIPVALEKAGLQLSDMDYIEVNEAFAAQMVANEKALGWERKKVNVLGGSIALGHPTGISGARLVIDLISLLHQRGGRYGVSAICGGDGIGVATIWQKE